MVTEGKAIEQVMELKYSGNRISKLKYREYKLQTYNGMSGIVIFFFLQTNDNLD